jgi:ribosomal protein L31E
MKRFFAALLIACVPATPLLAQEAFYRPKLEAADLDASVGTHWYGLYLKGKKIGHCQATAARSGDTIVETFSMNMKLVSFKMKVELKLNQMKVFEGKPPHRLLEIVEDTDDGTNKTRTSAKRNEKGFNYVHLDGGLMRAKQVADIDYALADSLASEVWIRSGPKVDAKIRTQHLDLKEWKLEGTNHKLKAVKTSLVNGVEVKFLEVESDDPNRQINYVSRYDTKGQTLSSNFAIFEIRRETEEAAKNTEFSTDLFVMGMAKLDKNVGHTTKLTELVLEFDGIEGDVLKNGPRQSIAPKEGSTARILKLGKKHGAADKVSADDIKKYLAETNSYAISDEKVQALAKKAIGDAKTDEEKVKRIVNFVYKFIEPKMTARLPSIHELMEKKTGDCKCYALLTTTLCRAAGIPSREVAGLVYMGDDVKAFGGHAWNEVVLGGVWVPLDASLNQTELDAGHISFGDDRVAANNMLKALGKLSFKVVNSQTSE